MGFADLIEQVVQLVQTLVGLRLERRPFSQNRLDLPFEAGHSPPQPIDMSGGINPRHHIPKKLTRFQLSQPVEGIAGIPQGLEPLSAGGKRCEFCLHHAQLTLEPLEFSPGLLDLRVQRRQFLR